MRQSEHAQIYGVERSDLRLAAVRAAAAQAGIEKLAPHDLRRTRARLCHLAGGEAELRDGARPRRRDQERGASAA
jgi:hypothetical protein